MSAIRPISQSVQLWHWMGVSALAVLLVVGAPANVAAQAAEEPNAEPAMVYICSPYSGAFVAGDYEGAQPYISIGSKLVPGTIVGNIRGRRQIHPVYSIMHGTIVEVLVDDGALVVPGQNLLKVQVEPEAVPV